MAKITGMLKWIKWLFTPGVSSTHGLRKTRFVGHSLSGEYYVCPKCFKSEVLSHLSETDKRIAADSIKAFEERIDKESVEA